MRGLLSAELLRFRSRRLVRILALVAFGILVLVQVRLFMVSNRDLAGAQRKAERAAAAAPTCAQLKAQGSIPPDIDCAKVDQNAGPSRNADDYYQDPRLFARKALKGGAQAVAVAMAILAFVVGASFIGAEWHSGTMQALLFWEPRRARVLLAKAVALIGGMWAIAAVLQAFCYGAIYLVAATRGSTAGLTAGVQTSILLLMLRGLVVIAFTALLGYAVAGLARLTGAALGVAFVYFVIIENLIFGLRPGWQRFLFTSNIGAVLLKKIDVVSAHGGSVTSLGSGTNVYHLTAGRGVVTLAVYVGLLLGVFYATFERRDVT
jgi:ABC-type transport system involved in multi-copper enzyme maturation permease subunit